MKPNLVVVGSLNMDLIVRAPRLPAPGETVTGGEFHHSPGGKGANQAVAAVRLGAHVEANPATPVDTTGAGDALVAGLAVGRTAWNEPGRGRTLRSRGWRPGDHPSRSATRIAIHSRSENLAR